MTQPERINRFAEDALSKLHCREKQKVEMENIINQLIRYFEVTAGRKVLNKPFKFKLEKVK